MKISRFSVQHPVIIGMILLALAVFGIVSIYDSFFGSTKSSVPLSSPSEFHKDPFLRDKHTQACFLIYFLTFRLVVAKKIKITYKNKHFILLLCKKCISV